MSVSSNAFLFVEKAQVILLPDNIRGKKKLGRKMSLLVGGKKNFERSGIVRKTL